MFVSMHACLHSLRACLRLRIPPHCMQRFCGYLGKSCPPPFLTIKAPAGSQLLDLCKLQLWPHTPCIDQAGPTDAQKDIEPICASGLCCQAGFGRGLARQQEGDNSGGTHVWEGLDTDHCGAI